MVHAYTPAVGHHHRPPPPPTYGRSARSGSATAMSPLTSDGSRDWDGQLEEQAARKAMKEAMAEREQARPVFSLSTPLTILCSQGGGSHASERLFPYLSGVQRSRRRLPLAVLCATAGFLLLFHHLAASPDSVRSSSSRPYSSQAKEWLHDSALVQQLRPLIAPLSGSGGRSSAPLILSAADFPFSPSEDPLPVHHLGHLMLYNNTPVSPHRPSHTQFLLDPRANLSRPVVAIITTTVNPSDRLLKTATTVFGQSLQNFAWVIVDNHSTDPASLALLAKMAKDPRVTVIQNDGQKGVAEARNLGLDYVFSRWTPPPKYLMSLANEDLLELTALEKTTWMLESNADWDIGGFRYVKWGEANDTVAYGLHSGVENWTKGNFVPDAAVFTSRAVLGSKCRYDEGESARGGEAWDFWMCLAARGHWGGTIPEVLYWNRFNFPTGDSVVDLDVLRGYIQRKYPSLGEKGGFPSKAPERNNQLEPVVWEAPFEAALAYTDKQIMFVVPWLWMGGADIGALHMIQLYALAGYRVTVLCTLYKPPEGIELRPDALQYTHDIHILPSFLRVHDFSRYFKHLVRSRGIKQVILSNTQLTYEMLPALSEQMPDVKFIDYLHNEAYNGWKSGGYPRYSIISQRYLARTITCSHYLKGWLLDNGYIESSRVGVVKLGIETSRFAPVTPEQRDAAKVSVLGVKPDTTVITFVGRLDPQKRPELVPRIVSELRKRVDRDFLVLMIGDGDLRADLERLIQSLDVGSYVRVLGTQSDPSKYLVASDMFLLPSMSEGISVAVAEAMAMGLPIVTARAGALPEQLGELDDHGVKTYGPEDLGGILVDHELDLVKDPAAYADAVASLVLDPVLRHKLGNNARMLVKGFDWRTTLQGLFAETKLAENLVKPDARYPHPAAYLSTQMLLAEMWQATDQSGFYPM